MLYAKKDLYAVEDDVRKQIAFAGQLVPREFEHLVDPADVDETPAGNAVQAPEESVVEPVADSEGAEEIELDPPAEPKPEVPAEPKRRGSRAAKRS